MPKKRPENLSKPDMFLLVLVLILVTAGLLVLFSTSEYNGRVRFHDSAYYFKKQLFATALGLGVMYMISSVNYRFFIRLAPATYFLSILNLPKLQLSCFLPGRLNVLTKKPEASGFYVAQCCHFCQL